MRRIEFMRRSKSLSQRALGSAARVDAGYICNAERYGFAKGVRLDRLAKALGWNGEPEALLDEIPQEVTA